MVTSVYNEEELAKAIKNNTDTVSTNFYSITEKYRDPNVLDKGINIHYMRDIVATTFLKKQREYYELDSRSG